MPFQDGFHVRSEPIGHRLDVGNGSTTANDGDALTLVLDGIEQLCEISRRIGSTDFCHEIRLSDFGVGGPTQQFCNLALAFGLNRAVSDLWPYSMLLRPFIRA